MRKSRSLPGQMDTIFQGCYVKDDIHGFRVALTGLKAAHEKTPDNLRKSGEEIYNSLFYHACESDAVNCLSVLLEGVCGFKSSSVDMRDRHGRTLLHVAASALSTNCIKLLISNGARTDLRLFNQTRHLALQCAVSSLGDKVGWSKDDPASSCLANLKKDEKCMDAITLLAAKTRGVEEMAYRYAMGGSLTSFAILMVVAQDKLLGPISLMIKPNGFRTITSIYDSVLDQALSVGDSSAPQDVERRKALLAVIEIFNLFEADLVPRKCCTIKISSENNRGTKICAIMKDDTALLDSLASSFVKEASVLLCRGTYTPISMRQEISSRLLHLACQHDAVKCAEVLLEGTVWLTAAQVDGKDRLGCSALDVAAEAHSIKCIELLISKDVSSNVPSVDASVNGPLPLEVALMSSRLSYVI